MRLGLLVASILTCGCRQIFGVETPGPLASDAAPDTLVPSDTGSSDASGRVCFTVAALGLTACPDRVLPPLDAPSDTVFDTSDTTFCDSASPTDTCLVATTRLSIATSAHVVVTGTRPLIVFATETITIAGTFDVASHVGGATGAGANPAACVAGSMPSGAGGGAGGSFGTRGGRGGDPSLLVGGTAGTSAAVMLATALRGGCAGQSGGGVTGGGAGGGALLLVADDQIDLVGASIVNASGQSGGASAEPSHGGNGGGAGGMIAMAAPLIVTAPASQVFANGGAGGGGANSVSAGSAGTDPTAASSGGGGGPSGGANGGTGGAGYPLANAGGAGVSTGQGGGGGGGGGGGVIRLFAATKAIAGAVSPPPS